jgi:hypothetical protein
MALLSIKLVMAIGDTHPANKKLRGQLSRSQYLAKAMQFMLFTAAAKPRRSKLGSKGQTDSPTKGTQMRAAS